jgi:DNA-binding IclR family transcriptional regulator
MSETVRSAARVLDMLEFFAGVREGVSLARVASAFSMPKSSALGLLRTLCSRGYVLRDAQGLYSLNEVFRTQGFGWGGNQLVRLMAMAQPMLEKLSSQLGESTSLGMLTEDGQIRMLLQSLSTQPVRYEASMGKFNPVHCTAMGRILLASATRAERDAILQRHPRKAYTSHTVMDLDQLHGLMDAAFERGWSLSAEEHELGGTGVSVAIYDASGKPVAAMNVACISARFAGKFEDIVAALTEEGARLQAQFLIPG